MVLKLDRYGGRKTRRVAVRLLAVVCLVLAPTVAYAYATPERPVPPCAIVGFQPESTAPCLWTFETIAAERPSGHDGRDVSTADLLLLERAGFATSDLTIDQTVAHLADNGAALLPWDRQVGIARELALEMGIGVDSHALRADLFLLMPATFNRAYLADFVDFTACQTAHTAIFAGALDGRSDAPYVTKRWSAMKVPVCLDLEGADCSNRHLKYDPARMYFRIDYLCHYGARRD